MWVVQGPLSDHVGRNSSCLACWWVVNWFQWQVCCLGIRRFQFWAVCVRRFRPRSFCAFAFSNPAVWKCFQPSVRELFVPILWLPRRCIFDGFLQDFEAFKGYVRPPVGPSVFGWLGLNPAGVSLFRMHRPLHVLGALKFKAEAATEAAIPSPSTTWFCMFLERFPEGAFSMASYRILRRSKGTLGPLSGRLSLAGWAWILLGYPCFACIVHSMFSGPLSSRPKLPPKLPFHPRPLHGFACFWNSALSLFRILPFESVSSRPYGSFSCRFCGFPEGAFSMAPRGP